MVPDRLESQSLGYGGGIGMSYRGMKSGTADLQPILGVKTHYFWRYLLQKSATPSLGCKGGKENEVIDKGVTAIKRMQQTLVP